jgi:hypothetical protein
MTEAEWLACEDPTLMLEYLREDAGDRKLRLFACVCFRETFKYHPKPTNEPLEELIAATEAFVDGRLAATDWERVRAEMPGGTFHPHSHASNASRAAVFDAARNRMRFGEPIDFTERAIQEQRQAAFLRDIFGNPFRPIMFSPSWRTDTALTLARQMYESRDFGAMPILADALQDAGCEDAVILGHCRGEGPHVRGCWVVDLVLRKE